MSSLLLVMSTAEVFESRVGQSFPLEGVCFRVNVSVKCMVSIWRIVLVLRVEEKQPCHVGRRCFDRMPLFSLSFT